MQTFFTDSIDFRSNIKAERCLSRFLLVNIDEFDQLSEKQFAFVKHVFQKPQTNIRHMYSEAIGTQRRYASFIGTSNHQEVLRDSTGNRRYICVEVTAPIRTAGDASCSQLALVRTVRYARGFRYVWQDIPVRCAKAVYNDLVYHFSKNPYYKRRNGQYLCTPEEQEYIRGVFEAHGVTGVEIFDGYEERQERG